MVPWVSLHTPSLGCVLLDQASTLNLLKEFVLVYMGLEKMKFSHDVVFALVLIVVGIEKIPQPLACKPIILCQLSYVEGRSVQVCDILTLKLVPPILTRSSKGLAPKCFGHAKVEFPTFFSQGKSNALLKHLIWKIKIASIWETVKILIQGSRKAFNSYHLPPGM